MNEEPSLLALKDCPLCWRTVLENIVLPFEIRGVLDGRIVDDALLLLESVKLDRPAALYPEALSGGAFRRHAPESVFGACTAPERGETHHFSSTLDRQIIPTAETTATTFNSGKQEGLRSYLTIAGRSRTKRLFQD